MDYSFTSWSNEQYCESIAIYGKFNKTYNPDTILHKPLFFEPINCATAFFIMFIGAYGLINSKSIYYYEDLIIFSSIFFNGVASLLNHATLQIGWYNMDDLTMLLPSTLTASIHYYCLVMLLNNNRFQKFYYKIFLSSTQIFCCLVPLSIFLYCYDICCYWYYYIIIFNLFSSCS